MNFIRKSLIGFIAIGAIVQSANAQNLVHNPDFDTDTSSWTTSISGVWSSAQDHTGSVPTGGSLQISTASSDMAQQCVVVRPNRTYIVSAWVTRDPNPAFAPCANPQTTVQVDMWNSGDCSIAFAGGFILSRLSLPEGWFNEARAFHTPDGTQSALIKLQAACPAGNAPAIIYFDDVSLKADAIFVDGFDGVNQSAP